jgi:hypothetical protein
MPPEWGFGATLMIDHMWDLFTVLILLKDCLHRDKQLVVPHTGTQRDRFIDAMQARNMRFWLYGQLELHHHCNKCLCLYKCSDDPASLKKSVGCCH